MQRSVSRARSAPKDVPPALGTVRLAEEKDASRVLQLCTASMKTTFRINSAETIEYLIQTAVLSITQLDENGTIIGFLSLKEYPQIPAVDPSAWEEYMWTKYKTIELKARNTVWIHLMCWNRRYNRELVDAMLRSVYIHDPYLHYICMTKSVVGFPQLIPGSSRPEAAFRRVQAMERGLPGDMLPLLMIAERKEMCPRLRVRRAVEEDNDDIVPIVDRHSERLRDMYGDFYVSELISRHPESDRVLVVCEHKEVAVGVMCLNTDINFESLEECFDLSPFAGLRKLDGPPPCKSKRNFSDPISESEPSVIIDNVTTCSSTDTVVKDKLTSDIKFDVDKRMRNESVLSAAEDGRLVGSADLLEYLDLFEEEDTEEDFDIVNIDPELLRVPYFTASEDAALSKIMDQRTKPGVHPLDDTVPQKREKKSHSTASMPKAPECIVRYSGAPNAFLLELCAMHHEYDERYAFDMLEAAFEIFPDRDYCVMCLPSSHAPFPLLEHFTLVTAHNTRKRFVNESLYVAHINSVKGDVSVRPGEAADRRTVVDLLEHYPKLDSAVLMFEESLRSHTVKSFMLLSQKQPVGIVITGPLEDGVAIRTRFDLRPEPWWALTDGVILVGCLSPVLEPHSRWYLRDVMRQSRYSSVFWICQPVAKGEQDPKRNMMSLAERMVCVRPRIELPNITGLQVTDKIFKDSSIPFALWIIERPLTSFPKVCVNSKIVVVGASRTGLAFLETLILGPSSKYLTFTNLTLVSEHGVPLVADCLKAAYTGVVRAGRFTDHYLKSIPFCFYVDVVLDVLCEIDRKKKCIYLRGGGRKFYDELVITSGEQFQHPEYLRESLENVKIVRRGLPCERVLMDDPKYHPDRVPPAPTFPENLFVINSLLEANIVFRKLLKMLSLTRDELSEKNRVVVYGDCLDSYCCMSALLELGLAGEQVAFVENFPPDDHTACRVNCFNDEVIDERVQDQLEGLGVKCYRNTRLVKLHVHAKRVTSLSLMDPMRALQVNCYALFYFGLKAINLDMFKAINECGLVYDGGLVLSPLFETNDPHIRGAGTCCVYSRSLYAAGTNHRNHNSEEVGEALAESFLRRFDPFICCHPEYDTKELLPKYSSTLYSRSHGSIPDVSPSRLTLTVQPAGRRWQPVMKFRRPIVRMATLPGPLHFLKVRKPGPEIPMEVQLNLPHQGHILTTDKDENYFRLRLSVLHCVDAVTCLSRYRFSGFLFVHLYGKHEAFFNRLLLRYQMEQIDDLYTYFTQPWLSAFYQETFDELMHSIIRQEVNDIEDEASKSSLGVKSEVKYVNSDAKPVKSEVEAVKSDAKAVKSDVEAVKSDAKAVKSDVEAVKSDVEAVKSEAKAVLAHQSSSFRNSRISFASKLTTSTCMDLQFSDCKLRGQPIWTLGELLKKYAIDSSHRYVQSRGPSDIPTECGQSETVRDEIGGVWERLGGEAVVVAHTAKHLNTYNIANPQYAPCDPEFI